MILVAVLFIVIVRSCVETESTPRNILISNLYTGQIRQIPITTTSPMTTPDLSRSRGIMISFEVQLEEIAHQRFDNLASEPLDFFHFAFEAFEDFAGVQRVGGGGWVDFEESFQFVVC